MVSEFVAKEIGFVARDIEFVAKERGGPLVGDRPSGRMEVCLAWVF